jgi:hypothetical protein
VGAVFVKKQKKKKKRRRGEKQCRERERERKKRKEFFSPFIFFIFRGKEIECLSTSDERRRGSGVGSSSSRPTT